MKSRDADKLLQAWRAALFDAASRCMISTSDIARDYERVRKGVMTRGPKFFTLDLPLIDETLLELLENGQVCFKGINRRRKSKRDSRPAFLHAFWVLVCDTSGCLNEEADPDAILAIRALSCMHKKLEVACSQARTAQAVKEFYEIESGIRPQPPRWMEDSLDPRDCVGFSDAFSESPLPDLFGGRVGADFESACFLTRLDRVAGILASELGSFDPESENSREHGFFKHGKGAVSNLRGSEYKYSFPSWPDKLNGVFDFGMAVGQLDAEPPSRGEAPSKLIAVPKTAKSPRLIASEPVEHQWCQQKVATWLDRAIGCSTAGYFIDLHNQALSQRLVERASIDRSLCTIDLSSASDRVTCQHIESLLRANSTLLLAAHAVRTRYVRDGVTGSGFHLLRKYSTMGSALTFPFQCLFFLAVVLASCGAATKADIKALRGRVRIFGDDIIAPNDAYDSIVTNLTALGLKVNGRKSFHKGHFRESCGADYWRGYNVTPIKPKVIAARAPEGLIAIRDTSNNYHKDGWWRVSEYYASLLPQRLGHGLHSRLRRLPDGSVGSEVPSLHAYSPKPVSTVRWDAVWHRWYTRATALAKRSELVGKDTSHTLREFFSKPWSGENPRQLGVRQSAAAVLASVRVEVTPLGNGSFAISS